MNGAFKRSFQEYRPIEHYEQPTNRGIHEMILVSVVPYSVGEGENGGMPVSSLHFSRGHCHCHGVGAPE